ncbi:hypothetical protein ACP6JD_001703 [Aspergillus fumigatus]
MNRVRFDIEEESEEESLPNGHPRDSEDSWLEEEDYARPNTSRSGRNGRGQMVPLLTDIEAPSVTLATSDDFFPEEHLENARPRSGMRMAFMNMANSIIGAGIIGQPYALRQAGMTMGVLLLCALTVAVDWTIRLIVVNSKLSGADSFQATMQHCFGKSGLIAISVAQWAFAFGGMIAFCIIRTNISEANKGFRVPSESRGEVKNLLFLNSGFFQAVGVISFAFVCHHNSLLIYGSLKKPTMDRFAKVTHYSTAVSLCMCLAMGISGFLFFGSKTQGNVLNNFPSDNVMVNIARL